MTELFNKHDEDCDGLISTDSLACILRGLHPNIREAKLLQMVKEVDADDSGQINLSEFTALVSKSARTDKQEQYRDAFLEYDTDTSGFISTQELQTAMLNLGEKLTWAEVEEMIQQVDKDADGQINYEEFIAMMTAEDQSG